MCSRLGCGASAGASSGRRSTPTILRISASASRPVCSTMRRASRSRSCSGRRSRRTAEACTVMTLTLWPTTSWSSRAILARSSRDRGPRPLLALTLGAGRPLSRLVRLLELPAQRERDRPDDAEDEAGGDEAVEISQWVLGRRPGSLHRSRRTSPATARWRSRSKPTRKTAAQPARKGTKRTATSLGRRRRCQVRPRAPTATGAPKGNRRREEERREIAKIASEVEPERALAARPDGPAPDHAGEAEPDRGEDQDVEPVAARELPEPLHLSKVLQKRRARLVRENEGRLVR